MQINTKLLNQYLSQHFPTGELLDALMHAGIEVEEILHLDEALRGIKIGVVEEIKPIAESRGLHVCRVNLGSAGTIPVVVGSEHEMREGWGVPVAPTGTRLPGGKVIGKDGQDATVMGHVSAGMICLDGEMGMLAEGTGLHVFEDASLAGAPLVDHADISESLLELSILPNRSDCLGLLGIAREVAAILGVDVVWPDTQHFPLSPENRDDLAVEIEAPEHCRRYIGGILRGATVGKSPPWLKSALLTLGANPINAVVDIANFVMFEWGQPLHAFDYRTIRGQRINVRHMRERETLTLLAEKEARSFQPDLLVIADAERPVAVAGIKGGQDTQTTTQTKDLLLEAAHFERAGIRRSSRALGLSTDSSYRYERGTDPNRMLEGAFHRAVSLITEITGAAFAGPAVDRYPQMQVPRTFRLDLASTSACLGVGVTSEEVPVKLGQLGMSCEPDGDDAYRVEVPTWRVDADDPVVLMEDLARLKGYDNIPTRASAHVQTLGHRSALEQIRWAAALFLSGNGFLECRSQPLTTPDGATFAKSEHDPVRLANALNEDMSALRRSLVPVLIDAADLNSRRGVDAFRYFEIDRVFHADEPEPNEQWMAVALLGGPVRAIDWSGDRVADFYDLKGIAENLLAGVGLEACTFHSQRLDGYADGHAAEIRQSDTVVGWIGQIGEEALRQRHVAGPLFAFELRLEAIERLTRAAAARVFRELPRTPPVVRDLAIVVDARVGYAQLKSSIREAAARFAEHATEDADEAAPRLESVACFDRYAGKNIGEHRVSLGLRLTFRHPTRTLTAESVTRVVESVLDHLRAAHGAELRH